MRRLTRTAAFAAVAAGITLGSGACSPTPPKPYAALIGDSLMVQSSNAIAFAMHNNGFDHVNVYDYGGTAPCDWAGTVNQIAASNPKPKAVVLEFAGNNYTACTGYKTGDALAAEYEHDIAAEVGTLEKAGIWTFVAATPSVSPAAQAKNPSISTDTLRHDEYLAATFAGGNWIDSDVQQLYPVEEGNGEFVQTMPCLSWETGSNCGSGGPGLNIVRAPDGIHFCPDQSGSSTGVVPTTCPVYDSGATRYGFAIAYAVGHPQP